MLKYLIVLLDDTSVSYCHYENRRSDRRLIPLEGLKAALRWAMKENLMVQFVYPSYNLSDEYLSVIDTVDHINITTPEYEGDVQIFDGIDSIGNIYAAPDCNIVLRLTRKELFKSVDNLMKLVKAGKSVRIIITDITEFDDSDFQTYKEALNKLSHVVQDSITSGNNVQLSLVTDRMQLEDMNSCNAGIENITLAPNGKFYICPAFYYDDSKDVGNPTDGLNIPNQQLLRLDLAPICRNCDAFQCKRCVWLNRNTTLEVNTPSHEQCVVSHLERNESRRLLNALKNRGVIRTRISIPKIDYLDPFEKIVK